MLGDFLGKVPNIVKAKVVTEAEDAIADHQAAVRFLMRFMNALSMDCSKP